MRVCGVCVYMGVCVCCECLCVRLCVGCVSAGACVFMCVFLGGDGSVRIWGVPSSCQLNFVCANFGFHVPCPSW